MKRAIQIVCVAAVVAALGSAAMAVDIETVRVGNPGNAADYTSYGAVDYAYNIGKYEVTAGQYTEFLNNVAGVDTYGLYNTSMWSNSYGCKIQQTGSSGSYSYSVASDLANRPVNYVSWGDAVRFANWLTNGQGNGSTETGAYDLSGATTNTALLAVVAPTAAQRETWSNGAKPYFLLTSEDEWYKAAYYDGGTSSYYRFPTSSDTAPGYVNDSGNLSEESPSVAFTEGGTDPGNYATYDGDGGTNGIGSPYYRTVAGEWENSDSPYGTFDQGGNVWEWNETISYGSERGLRGGGFYGYDDSLQASYRIDIFPTYERFDIGFRVSEVPEPATMAIFMLGGLAIIKRRRR